jgi:hypothetical protein
MRLQDIVNEDDKQLNEFLPALAAGAARIGSTVGGALAKGAQTVGSAIGKAGTNVAQTAAGMAAAMPATSNDPKIQSAMLAQQQKQTQEQRKAIQDQITAVTKQLTDLRRQLTQLQ